jgi:hypothetical protein
VHYQGVVVPERKIIFAILVSALVACSMLPQKPASTTRGGCTYSGKDGYLHMAGNDDDAYTYVSGFDFKKNLGGRC